jgi:hypothetical protein
VDEGLRIFAAFSTDTVTSLQGIAIGLMVARVIDICQEDFDAQDEGLPVR